MKTFVGFFDKLFGEKVTLELPQSDGSKKKVKVSKKWLEKMKSEGKIEEIGFEVTMHILGVRKYKEEKWIVGQDIDHESYNKFKDDSGDIYGMRLYENGELKTYFLSKERWIEGKKEIGY